MSCRDTLASNRAPYSVLRTCRVNHPRGKSPQRPRFSCDKPIAQLRITTCEYSMLPDLHAYRGLPRLPLPVRAGVVDLDVAYLASPAPPLP